jgi:outer membrane protein OmpU
MRGWARGALLWGLAALPIAERCMAADEDVKPWIPTPSVALGNSLLSIVADGYGAGYIESQPGGVERDGLTGALLVQPELGYPFQNGWILGVRTAFLVHHDRLSGDNYGNDVVEKAYLYLETAYGRIEAGQQDGAAYKLEATGPLVTGPPAIDDANVTFYIDPGTGKAFTNIFPVRTGVFATSNAAKVSYYSPRSVDLQVGLSFTPSETKGFPFLSHSDSHQNVQRNITEAGANYVRGFGQIMLHAYAGLAFGLVENRTPGHRNALDWALGGQVDYNLNWGLLSFGGAYRQSRGYTFDIDESLSHGDTDAVHLTARLTKGPWEFGFEYSAADAAAAAQAGLPDLSERGYEPQIGYTFNPNLQLSLGYQHLDYQRNIGSFYNGKPELSLNAGFLYFEFKV